MPEVPKLLHDLVLYILKVGLCGKKKKKSLCGLVSMDLDQSWMSQIFNDIRLGNLIHPFQMDLHIHRSIS